MAEEKIELTLASALEEAKAAEEAAAKELEKPVDLQELKDAGYEGLSEQEKETVEKFAKTIDLEKTTDILQYGSAAQGKVADFSDNVLKNIRTKDAGEDTEKMLTGLIKNINMSDDDSKGLKRLFQSAKAKAKETKDRYDSVSANVEEIAKMLENHQVVLMKDVNLLDQLYEKNLTNFKELSMYILAGYKALDNYKNTTLKELEAKAKESGLPEDAQKVKDAMDAINRFEKRIHDLELTRVVSLQMGPQIRLVQNNDTTMIEKIQSTLVNTIPLWKSQILITLGIEHSTKATKAQNEVSEMTNKMLKQNAEKLKMATIETAKESERGIVDVKTLTETNKKLIETLDEVRKIQEEGKTKRAEALVELRRIENELNEKLAGVRAETK